MGLRTQEALAFRLRKAGGKELAGLVERHLEEIGIAEIRQLLLNPFTSLEVIEELVRDRRLMALHAVRYALVRHPRIAETSALRLLPNLFWRELLVVAVDMRLSPLVRRVAERTLLQRLPRLSSGEKINLARRVGVGVLGRLLQDPNIQVVRAVLGNPRLTEAVLMPLVGNHGTHPRILDLVAGHQRWRYPYALRQGLASNPMTPLRVVFRLLPTLRRGDLRRVAAIKGLASVVRFRARELAAGRGGKEGKR